MASLVSVPRPPSASVPLPCHFFWHGGNALPEAVHSSMAAWAARGFAVNLWAFSKYRVRTGRLQNLGPVMPVKTFQAHLRSGVDLQKLKDVLQFGILKRKGGVFADVDMRPIAGPTAFRRRATDMKQPVLLATHAMRGKECFAARLASDWRAPARGAKASRSPTATRVHVLDHTNYDCPPGNFGPTAQGRAFGVIGETEWRPFQEMIHLLVPELSASRGGAPCGMGPVWSSPRQICTGHYVR